MRNRILPIAWSLCSISALTALAARADPIPTFTASSATASWSGSGNLTFSVLGPSFTMTGGGIHLIDLSAPVGGTMSFTGIAFSLQETLGPPLIPNGTVVLGSVTHNAEYVANGLGGFVDFPIATTIVPATPHPVLTLPAVLSGTYTACINFVDIGPQFGACEGAAAQYVADIAIDLPGVLTLSLSGPGSNGFDIFAGATFTSTPEPSSLLLVLAGSVLAIGWVLQSRALPKQINSKDALLKSH